MAQKKGSRSSIPDDQEDLSRVPLQAVLLADSFTQKFLPITLERPKVLMPLVNAPMIDYTLAWLESVGVEEVYVFCHNHSDQVKDYLRKSQWLKQPSTFSVTTIESQDARSAGDALRVIYNQGVIRGDFVLISGDTVCNMKLDRALQEHKERRKKDALAVMTMVIKHSKPSPLTHQTRLGDDEIIMAIHPDSKELLYYEDKVDQLQRYVSLDKVLLSDNPAFCLHNDKQDCYIDICSPEVLSLFTDNFDYQHLRRHFVKGLLGDDIMGYKIFTYEAHSCYAARIDNFRSYDTISKDIIQRWTYPLVPDIQYFGNSSHIRLDRHGIYKGPDVILSRSSQICASTVIGMGTTIGDHTVVSESVIGQQCTIGKNVSIKGSYIWDNVTIEDNCNICNALICDAVHLRVGVVLKPGVILSFKVEVGQHFVVRAYSKVSLFCQPSSQDSDEEVEPADASNVAVDSPSIASVARATNVDTKSDFMDEQQSEVPGKGFIWSEGGREDEWRLSIAPIPKEKLGEMAISALDAGYFSIHEDEGCIPASEEFIHDSDSFNFDGEDCGDADFEKEVEATFLRATVGVSEENVILEINSLRLSYNMSQIECAGAVFNALMKWALSLPHSSKKELLENTRKELPKWKKLLMHYLISRDEEVEVILKFEEMCCERATEFSDIFMEILNLLYDEEILSEEAIQTWELEKSDANEADKRFLRQAEPFLEWLRQASEEE